jgi:Zn-dependent protease with chaperone function
VSALLWVLAAYASWVAANLLLMALAPAPDAPSFNGFRIRVPRRVRDALAPEELEAVLAHERGHRARLHVWKNFALVCAFSRQSRAGRLRQEHEADDHAAALGHGPALASALRKIGGSREDFERAARLERNCS